MSNLSLFHARLEERRRRWSTQQQHRSQAQRSFPQQRLPAHRDDHDLEWGSGEYILPVTGTRRLHAALSDQDCMHICAFQNRPSLHTSKREVRVCVHHACACSRWTVFLSAHAWMGFVTNAHSSGIDLCIGEWGRASCVCVNQPQCYPS